MQLRNGEKIIHVEALRMLLQQVPGHYYAMVSHGNLALMDIKNVTDIANTGTAKGTVNFGEETVELS